MAIPSGAILLFPTGTDVYSNKVDRGTIVSGESHVIPGVPPYQFFTYHVPLFGSPGTTTSIPGYVEVTGTPINPNHYVVTYSGNNAGLFTFATTNPPVAVTYTANGDDIVAEWFNSLQTSVTNVESYIISGSAFAGNVRVTGSSMTGNLVMNGGSIFPATSGTSQLGTSTLPFGEILTDVVSTFKVQDVEGNDTILLGGDLIMSGNNAARLQSNNLVQLSGSTSVDIIAGGSGLTISVGNELTTVGSHILPTGSFVYDLGADTQRWRTVYADNFIATSNPYVRVSGDTMTGDLVMQTGTEIVTDNIANNSSSLSLDSSSDINLTAAGNVSVNSGFTNINSNLQVTPTFIGVNSTVTPAITSAYDLGSSTNKFRTIYADNLEGVAISGAFVHVTGDSMTGDLSIGFGAKLNTSEIASLLGPGSGTINVSASQLNILAMNNTSFSVGTGLTNVFDIGISQITLAEDMIPAITGTYDIGSAALPLRAIYADNLHIGNQSSGSQIYGATFGNPTFTGTITLGTDADIVAFASGTNDLGSPSNPLGTIYADNIVTNGSTGTFLVKFGDTMLGDLALGTGVDILPIVSGNSVLGSAAVPFSAIYADNLFGSNLSNLYVLKAGDTMTGALTLPQINATGNLNIVAAGFLNLTGNQITEMAQQITLTSTVGPIILGAQTELQLMSNSTNVLVVNTSGVEAFADIFPDVSGTRSLGTAIKPFENIFARNIIPIGASGTGTFVLRIGDSMLGNLSFESGINIVFATSGTSDIGTANNPARAIYADNIVTTSVSGAFVHVTGDLMTGALSVSNGGIFSDIYGSYTAGASLVIGSGANTVNIGPTPTGNGRVFLSATGMTIVNRNAPLELITSGLNTSGNIYPHQSGTSSIGTLAIPYANFYVSGINTQTIQTTNMTANNSGLGIIGSLANPFLNIFVKTINGQPVPIAVYNEIPAGTINNVNVTFNTAFTPLSGTQRLYRAGLRMTPGSGLDYLMSGTTITFANAPISGDNLLIDYSRLP